LKVDAIVYSCTVSFVTCLSASHNLGTEPTDNIPYKPKTPFILHKLVTWSVYTDKEHSINTIMTDQLRPRITFVDNNNCYCGQWPVA
jgi:hypothetical protein